MRLRRPADRVVRHPRQAEIGPVRLTAVLRQPRSRILSSPLLLAYAMVALIVFGTILLLLPWSTQSGAISPPLVAFFTAASAVTLTGLEIVQPTDYWSKLGYVFILGMIFAGGVVYMTIATYFMAQFGRRLELSQRILGRENPGIDSLRNILRLALAILAVASLIQIAGFAVMFVRLLFTYQVAEAVWQAVFLSVSSFNNAGFTALPGGGNLYNFGADYLLLTTIMVLMSLGALGYWVIFDVVRNRKYSRFTLNTKLVLVVSAILTVYGAAAIFAVEFSNPETLGGEQVHQKAYLALFESVSSRTTGFTVIDVGADRQHTNFFVASLMFVGGATGSAAGGIKVTTLGIILMILWGTPVGKNQVNLFGRELPFVQVQRALVIGVLAFAFVFVTTIALAITDSRFDAADLLFETVSAFSTTGFSSGIVPDLSVAGKLIIIIAMFTGRVGPLILAFWLASRLSRDKYSFGRENVTIG